MALEALARFFGVSPQGRTLVQSHRDHLAKGSSFSIEAEISEALADLTLMYSQLPIEGDTERAKWMDSVADSFMRGRAYDAIVTAFTTGDCLVVPAWNGRNVQHLIVGADDFEIYQCAGDEILSCAYTLDTRTRKGRTYRLVQRVELVETQNGHENRYETMVITGSNTRVPLSEFPDWEAAYEPEWSVPGVDRLLVGRYKSFTRDPADVNNVKGAPICYGAGEFIAEIHYLLGQMHNEYGFSEKAIMASRRMFEQVDENGNSYIDLPQGRRRLFSFTRGSRDGSTPDITEWAPDIRYEAYIEGLNAQLQNVERAVGVSSVIISIPNDVNSENVDN